MAGKRIKEEAPLTPGEKQKRYRQKQEEEKKERIKKIRAEETKNLREKLILMINGIELEDLIKIADFIIYGPEEKLVSLEELSAMMGIPISEMKELKRKGIITPADENRDRDRLSLEEIMAQTGIPLEELQELERKGVLQASRKPYIMPSDSTIKAMKLL